MDLFNSNILPERFYGIFTKSIITIGIICIIAMIILVKMRCNKKIINIISCIVEILKFIVSISAVYLALHYNDGKISIATLIVVLLGLLEAISSIINITKMVFYDIVK